MISIRWILFLAFAVVILVAIGTIAAISLRSAATQIAEYDELADDLEMTRITHWLTGYYDIHESWDDVQPYLDEIGVMYGRRVVLTDTSDRVVADTRIDGSARFGGPEWRVRLLQFDRFHDPVGTVHVNHDMTIVDSFRQRLAASIRVFLLLGSGIAFAIALLVSLAISHPMIAPIRGLARVSERAAGGDLRVRTSVPRVRELRSLALSFNKMMADLEAAETLRKNMIADVAHELRTPLSNVRGYLEARRDGVVADEEAVAVVEREMMTLTRLVDDLQELSIAESGGVELSRERVDLRDVLRRAVESFRPSAAERGVHIRIAVPAEPVVCIADPVRISQSLGNLLKNALTHVGPDGGTIDLSLIARNAESIITVADDGAGIPPAHLPYVFERFYRADGSRSRSTGGHGLGLTIARSIAIAHGGTLTASSTEGEGSSFVLTLPCGDFSDG